jgi:hypothetical protein
MPGRQRRLPACMDQRRAAIVVVCCPPWMSFMICDRHSFRQEEENEEDDSNVPKRGTITRNDDNHQRLQLPWEAQHRRMMELEHCRDRAATAMALRNVSLDPPRPVIGRHHSREEGCGSETLSSRGDVDDVDGENDDGWFQMKVPLLINKHCNASFRRTYAMRVQAF